MKWFNKILHPDNNEDENIIYTGGNIMKTNGEFTCVKCSNVHVNPKMMDIDVDDDSKGSLIFCPTCEAWCKWE